MVELKQNTYSQSQSTAIDQGLRDYMMKVYNYMTSGLAISGLVALGFLGFNGFGVFGGLTDLGFMGFNGFGV